MVTQTLSTSSIKHDCRRCSVGKFLLLLMIGGLTYLVARDRGSGLASSGFSDSITGREDEDSLKGRAKFGRFWRKPPRLPPRLSPDEVRNVSSNADQDKLSSGSEWIARQAKVKEAFVHAWNGYSKYAMGYDELMPLSKRGTDSLGGLGATVVDALDTAIIMGADEVVSEAGVWVEKHLMERINTKGQVNLFETTIRVLGGLLSAYHLSGGDQSSILHSGISVTSTGVKAEVILEIAKNLADRLLTAFTSSSTSIPYSDVVLRDRSAHPAPDGLSSTSEASTVQLEFNYLSKVSGDPKYGLEAMKVLEHFKTLPKVEGLVPIYIRLVERDVYCSN